MNKICQYCKKEIGRKKLNKKYCDKECYRMARFYYYWNLVNSDDIKRQKMVEVYT